MRQRSIRFRLTLWYLTALSLGIVLFGTSVWLVTRQQLLANREEGIDRRLNALGPFLNFDSASNNLAAVAEEAGEYAAGLPAEQGFRLLDEQGRVMFERKGTGSELLTRRQQVVARGMRFQAELSVPLDDLQRTLSVLQWVLWAALPVVLAAAGLMGWWLAGRALRPVDAMTREARAIHARDLSARLSVSGTGDELQRLGAAWNELLARIETSVQTVTRFTADAAHELRTPLAVIRTTSELALRHERSAEQYRKTLESIHRETESMTELVEQLLLLAREDSGQWQFRFDALRLGDVLRGLQEPLAAEARQRRIELTWTLPAQEPLIWADEGAMRRVVMILADNALKYTAAGGRVAVRLSNEGAGAVVEVEDTGCGIAAEHLPHVFERFYRADAARTAGSGAGLGLSIARTIVEAHRGWIEMRSCVGEGTCVRVSMLALDSQVSGSQQPAHA